MKVKRSSRTSRSAEPAGASLVAGRYEVRERIAVGGMAEIFLARIVGPGGFRRPVVLKRILPPLREPRFVSMFLDEARLAATLAHPGIVQVEDVGLDEDGPYMVMEFVHGRDLRRIMAAVQSGPHGVVPAAEALGIVGALAAALDYAHQRRAPDGTPLDIVHRDVSPSNVMIGWEGTVKLLDFGIAKAARRLQGETRIGVVKGKIGYMSPEQCLGRPVDRRSDVFALGVMLYELTVGERPFAGPSDQAVTQRIIQGRFTPPRKIEPRYDPALEAIVLRAMALDREARFATAAALGEAIEALGRERRWAMSPRGIARWLESLLGPPPPEPVLEESTDPPTIDEDDAATQARQDPSDAATQARQDPSDAPTHDRATDETTDKAVDEDASTEETPPSDHPSADVVTNPQSPRTRRLAAAGMGGGPARVGRWTVLLVVVAALALLGSAILLGRALSPKRDAPAGTSQDPRRPR